LPGAVEHTLAVAEGSSRSLGGVVAPDVQTWVASPEQGLTAAVESASGAEETAEALARLAPCRLTVLAAVAPGQACWAEITRRSGDEAETCIAGLTYDGAGAVSRLVWLRAPLVPAPEVEGGTFPAEARPILESYFADLMTSDFRGAAAHFTVDTVYSHPPYAGGTERVLFRGREALWRGFVTERGPSPARQVITNFWQRGGRVFVEGVVEGIRDGGTFFVTAQISPDGEIARYVAFYSARRISA
jgi:ketosteroid isomerase-like protein